MSIHRILRRTTIPTVAAAVALTGFAGTALADAPTPTPSQTNTATPDGTAGKSLAAIQQAAHVAIDLRLTSLASALTVVNSSGVYSPADKSALLSTLNGDVSGLTALGQKIAADTSVTTAKADYHQIFTGYRVYALALPQVHYARATDTLTSLVLPRLTAAQATLNQLLAATGKGNAATAAAMADLTDQINAITGDTSGLSASVVAYTPAQWNANHELLTGPRQTLSVVRSDVTKATTDIKTVVGVLK